MATSTTLPSNFDLVSSDASGKSDYFYTKNNHEQAVSNWSLLGSGDGYDCAYFSGDGRYCLFGSSADNLLPNPLIDNIFNYFYKDITTGAIQLIPRDYDIVTSVPVLSDDGIHVAFLTSKSLVPEDATKDGEKDATLDVYVKNMMTGVVTLASEGKNGNVSTFTDMSISSNGRYVSFYSSGGGGFYDPDGGFKIKDMQTGTTRHFNFDLDPGLNKYEKYSMDHIYLSSDGRYLVYRYDQGLDPNKPASVQFSTKKQIYRTDLQTNQTVCVSTNVNGVKGDGSSFGDYGSYEPQISADGRYVIFRSYSNNLVPDDTDNSPDLFYKDMQTGAIQNLTGGDQPYKNLTFSYHSMSDDGRYVAVTAYNSSMYLPGTVNNVSTVAVKDMQTGEWKIVSSTIVTYGCELSSDGKYILLNANDQVYRVQNPFLISASTNNNYTGGITIKGETTVGKELSLVSTVADADGLGTFNYQWLSNGAAISGATKSTYTLTANEVGKNISVKVNYTDKANHAESVTSGATGFVTALTQTPVTPTVTLSSNTATVNEGGSVTYTATLSSAATTMVSVLCTVRSTSATLDDFIGSVSGTIYIPTGSTTGSLTLNVANDLKTEGAESFFVTLESPTGATLGSTIEAYTTIKDTSLTPSVNPAVNHAPTGTVTISGTPQVGQILTANNTLADADGMGVVSYQWKTYDVYGQSYSISGATQSTYTLTASDVGKAIWVVAFYTDQKGTAEAMQSANELVTKQTAVTPTVNLSSNTSNVNEGGSVIYTATLSSAATTAVSIQYTFISLGLGLSVLPSDFIGLVPTTGTIYIPAGSTTGSLTFNIANDSTTEDTESFMVTLDSASGATLGSKTGVYTIINDTSLTPSVDPTVNHAPTGTVTVSGTPQVGQTLTANNTLADADGMGQFSYSWGYIEDNGASYFLIPNATQSTYTLTASDIGKSFYAEIFYTDLKGNNEQIYSDDTKSVTAATQTPVTPTGFVKTLLSNRIFTVSDNDVTAIGGTAGNEIVRIQSGVINTTLNANIERLELGNALSSYKFIAVSGVGVEIWNASSKIATIPSLNQDTKIAFSNGTAILQQTGASDFQLGNAAISNGTATTPSNVVIDSSDLSGSQTAQTSTGFIKTLLSNSVFTVSDNDVNVIGGTAGNEVVRIQSGVTNTMLNANIERVELSGALSAYKFVSVSGVGVEIWNASSKIATIPSLNQDTKIAFSNGTAILKQTGASDFQLGNAAISNTTATTLSNVLLDSSDLSTIGVTGSTNINATNLVGTVTAGVDTFNIATGTYNATINGFAAGDKLSFFAGASIQITPDTNQTDGLQQLTATNAATGATATITLTGLTAAQDLNVFNVNSFNSIFGAGAIV